MVKIRRPCKNHIQNVHKRIRLDATGEPGQTGLKVQSTLTLSSKNFPKMLPVKTEIIHRNLALMCVMDLRPVNIVAGYGFRNLVTSLNPSYKIPSRATINGHIDKLNDETRGPIVEQLQNAAVALTSDIWTSLSTDGYICLTAHYLTKNWELCNRLIATRIIEDRHTGIKIAKVQEGLTTEFGIKEVSVLVTHNASNRTKAAAEAGTGHTTPAVLRIPCNWLSTMA